MDVASLFSMLEGAVFDRKSRLLVVENATDEKHKDGRSDFVRHTVAMANYSRLSGRKGYIVFGIMDEEHTKPLQVANNGKGILNQSAISSDDVPWPEDLVKRNEYWKTHVQKPYEKMIHTYILPSRSSIKNGPKLSELNFSLESLSHQEGLLALLTIEPTPTKDPFFVKDYQKLGLSTRHFVRVSDNSIGIAEEDARLLTRWTNEPYVTPDVWKTYLQQLKIIVADAFPKDTNTPDTYQYVTVESLDKKQVRQLEDVWHEVLASKTHSNQFIVFVGEPGAGKTWGLKRKLFELADAALTELENDEKLLEPTTWIPVYTPISRREGLSDLSQEVANNINGVLSRADRNSLKVDIGISSARQLRFLVAVDGIDEIPFKNISDNALKINTFVKSHPKTNNAVTTREFCCPSSWLEKEVVYRVLPLSQQQILSFLGSRLTKEQIESPRLSPLLKELASLLSMPRLLQAFTDYLEGNPIPNSGIAIKEILKKIKKVEAGNSGEPLTSFNDQWSPVFQYAIDCIKQESNELYEEEYREEHALPRGHFNFYLNAGLLEKVDTQSGEIIRFAHSEYLDNLNAQTLLTTENKNTVSASGKKERLLSALNPKPDHLIRTTRYLLNMTDGDISQSPWVEWLHRLADPILQLRIIAERQNSQFGELSVLETILLTLVEKDHDHPSCMYWLHVLLQDLNTQIASRVLEKLDKSHVALSEQQILSLLHDPSQSYEVQLAALDALVRAELDSGRQEAAKLAAVWLEDHTQPRQVEDALNMIARLKLLEISDQVYMIGMSDLPYSDGIRENAHVVLKQLGDPRHEELEKRLHPVAKSFETATDDPHDGDSEPAIHFDTSLTSLPNSPSDIEVLSKEEE